MTYSINEITRRAIAGNDVWVNNGSARRAPLTLNKTFLGAVEVGGSLGAIIDIESTTSTNFQYTTGVYGATVPGTGDQATTFYILKILFPDAKAASSTIIPLTTQFERCPIIPVFQEELLVDGITAAAQLQMNIRTVDDLPGGIVVELVLIPINISNYIPITKGEHGNEAAALPNFWAYVNYSLLRWFVYEFRHGGDLRYVVGDETAPVDVISLMEEEFEDPSLSISRIGEDFLDNLYGVNTVMEQIMGILVDSSSAFLNTLEDENGEIIDQYTAFQRYIDGPLQEAMGIEDDTIYDEFINGSAGFDGIGDNLRTLYDELVGSAGYFGEGLNTQRITGAMADMASKMSEFRAQLAGTEANELVNAFDHVDLTGTACTAVSLQMVNHFKPLDLAYSGTGIWQYMGPGQGSLNVEVTEYKTDKEQLSMAHNNIRRMFYGLADDIRQLNGITALPPSIMFSRVVSWPTLLAGKLYYSPDAMTVSNVPGQPSLRSISMKFTMFDTDLVRRTKIGKMWEDIDTGESTIDDTSVTARGLNNRFLEGRVREGDLGFYDSYALWFLAEEGVKLINAYSIELPTWEEVLSIEDDLGPLSHISKDTIDEMFGDPVVSNSTGAMGGINTGDVNTHLARVSTTINGAFVPPDFWCMHDVKDFMEPYAEIIEDIESTAETSDRPETTKTPASPWAYDIKAIDYWLDEQKYSGKFSLRRAFPSTYFLFTDHYVYGFGARMTDMSWGYGALQSMSIGRFYNMPVDFAKIRLINLFGTLDDPVFMSGGLMELILSTSHNDLLALHDQLNLEDEASQRNRSGVRDTVFQDIGDWFRYTFSSLGSSIAETWANISGQYANEAERFLAALRDRKANADVLPLSVGQWAHIRMGYGQPYMLPTVFNGRIASFRPGPVVDLECEGFGSELAKPFPAEGNEQDNSEPRKQMAEYLNKPKSGEMWTEILHRSSRARDSSGGMLGSFSTSLPYALMPGQQGTAVLNFLFREAPQYLIGKGIELWYPTEGLGMDRWKTRMTILSETGEDASLFLPGNHWNIGGADGRQSVNLMSLMRTGDTDEGDSDIRGNIQSEISLNIYPASPSADAGKNQNAEWSVSELTLADEVEFGFSPFGKSFIDFGITCRRLTGDYIFTVVPFANRATIFYGKAEWPMWGTVTGVAADTNSNEIVNSGGRSNGDVIVTRQPFNQMSTHSVIDIIDNNISTHNKFYTGIRPMWSHGKEGNMVEETRSGIIGEVAENIIGKFFEHEGQFEKTPIQWFDADIHPTMKRVNQIDTGILRITKPEVPGKDVMEGIGFVFDAIAGISLLTPVGPVVAPIAGTIGLILGFGPMIIEWTSAAVNQTLETLFGTSPEEFFADEGRRLAEIAVAQYRCPAPELAQVKGPFWEGVNATAKGILKEEMENLYIGAMYVVGNPVVRPHCIQSIYDLSTHMVGPFVAGNVFQHFGLDTGFVTEIHPKCLANAWRPEWLQSMTLYINSTGVKSGYDVAISWAWANKVFTDSANDPNAFIDGIIGGVTEATGVNPFSERSTLLGVGKGFTASGPPINELRRSEAGRHLSSNADRTFLHWGQRKIGTAETALNTLAFFGLGNINKAAQETIQAARSCYIAPLQKNTMPYVGGITGWRGSVVVNGEILMPSEADIGHGTIPGVSELYYSRVGADRYFIEDE